MEYLSVRSNKLILFLVAALLLLCSCASSDPYTGSDMTLTAFEGDVTVRDEKAPIETFAGMNLYDKYSLATKQLSYSWIELDETKLLKMDETSAVRIEQHNKGLKIHVNAGALLFCVSEALEEDESLEFQTKNVSLSIRGTTGVIRYRQKDMIEIMMLEGEGLITVGDQNIEIRTNEKAVIVTDGQGKIDVEVSDIALYGDVPDAFVKEIDENKTVHDKIAANGGNTQFVNGGNMADVLEKFTGTWFGGPVPDRGFFSSPHNYVDAPYTWYLTLEADEIRYHFDTINAPQEIRASGFELTADDVMYGGTSTKTSLSKFRIISDHEYLTHDGMRVTLSEDGNTLTFVNEEKGKTVIWTRKE